MTGCLQRLADAGETGARRIFGECERGQTTQMSDLLTGLMELALQVAKVCLSRCSVTWLEQPACLAARINADRKVCFRA